ncbi:MAG: hypothetical protein V3U86_02960 [Acidobacteriota bacterium]|nr:hypothetical protein [Acidobacteriota bacterium]
MPSPSAVRIIFVHGLASKPPEAKLLELWKKALIENVRTDSKTLASSLEKEPDLFRSAYWANAVPDHIEDSPGYVKKLERAVDAVIRIRRDAGKSLHISKAGWVGAKVKKFGQGIVYSLAGALTLKDNVISQNIHEISLYRADQYVADRIREPLERELGDAWKSGKQPVIIAHSMGSFVVYDVLWRFSHRSEAFYREHRKDKVGLLITMGSPLGDSTLRDFMLIERWKEALKSCSREERRRYYPTNIRRWQNYCAYGDIVCHDSTLDNDFFEGLRSDVGGYGRNDLRDYARLYNPYVGTAGKPNPHKSYGYLIQPKLSQKLRSFLGSR